MSLMAAYNALNEEERMQLRQVMLTPALLHLFIEAKRFTEERISIVDPDQNDEELAREFRKLRMQKDVWLEFEQLTQHILKELRS